jgi:hypothetical protein
MSYHLFVGEHREGIEPVEGLRAGALDPLLKALAFQEAREGEDSYTLLRQLAPLRLVRQHRGEIEEAAGVVERAKGLVRARIAELSSVSERGETVESGSWNFVCWWGSLAGAAQDALPACAEAVEASPRAQRGGAVDSRALAFALLGRLEDAAADFRFALAEGTYSTWQIRDQRTRWAEALEQGENPFDVDALATLAF